MQLKVKYIGMSSGGPLIAIINKEDAKKLDVHALDRIKLKKNNKEIIVAVDIAKTKAIKPGYIGLLDEVLQSFKVKKNEPVFAVAEQKPLSLYYIKKKLDGETLDKHEIDEIVKDIVSNKLTEIEITAFVSGCYINGLTLYESAYLTEAIVANGKQLDLKAYPILDKHCLIPETPFIVDINNRIETMAIGEFIDKFIPEDCIKPIEKEITENIKVPSFNKDAKIEFKKIKRIFKIPYEGPIVQLNLIGNRNISVTPNHTIYVLRNNQIVNIPAIECKKSDHIVIPNKINFETKEKINLNISKINMQKEGSCKKLPNHIEFTPEFARLIGYYISEGFSNEHGVFFSFGSHEKELIEDCINCIRKVFRLEPTVRNVHKTAIRIRICSKLIKNLFDSWGTGQEALTKKIPYFVFNFNEKLKKEFLKGYIYGDGYRRRKYETVIVSASQQLATDLMYLLSSMGICYSLNEKEAEVHSFPNGTCMVSKCYCIYTQTKEIFDIPYIRLPSFNNLIPTKEIINSINLKAIRWETRRLFKRERYVHIETLKKVKDYITNKDVLNLINNDLRVVPIKTITIKDSPSKYVYDIEVEDNHNFFAGNAPVGIHNCVGGVAGNRTTPLIVSIVAAAGFTIPKTSTRSITSVSGTADTCEVFAPVTHTKKEIEQIVKKTNACMVWGGALELASADDKLIKVERPLNLDPEGILLASILAKKAAVKATHILIDIPIGRGTKFQDRKNAKRVERKFKQLGKLLGMNIKVILTNGSQPIGNGIGPALEARDILLTLQSNGKQGPQDLKKKALTMSGILLQMVGVKNGYKKAVEILGSGQAYKKFREIIKAQGGNPNISVSKIKIGRFKHEIRSKNTGIVKYIDNNLITKIAKMAGAPENKGAGIYLNAHLKDKVKKNDVLFTIYSENKKKMEYAADICNKSKIIEII